MSTATKEPYDGLVDLASLGIEPVINANTTQTRLGGSLMPEPVLDAMRMAARRFVDIEELQAAAGRRLATLTRNEAAYVSAGAATGLMLATLAAMTGPDTVAAQRVADGRESRLKHAEVIVQAPQWTPYERSIRLGGVRVVHAGNMFGTTRLEVEAAISEHTVAIVFFAGQHVAAGALDLEDVLELGHAAGLPVIVDAAAQLPPVENLWAFTQAGADLVVFSGGKGLRGPAPTGLLVGRKHLIEACVLHGYPHQRIGRPMKVGKEEIVGLVAAVEWFLRHDHATEAETIERATQRWIARLDGLRGIRVMREYPGEAGRPVPRVLVSWVSGPAAMNVRTLLLQHRPRIDVAIATRRALYLNAELLSDEEVELVADAITDVLREAGIVHR